MRFMIIQIIYKLNPTPFEASGLVVMGFVLWVEGSGKQGLRVVRGEAFFVRFLRDSRLC